MNVRLGTLLNAVPNHVDLKSTPSQAVAKLFNIPQDSAVTINKSMMKTLSPLTRSHPVHRGWVKRANQSQGITDNDMRAALHIQGF